MVTDFRLKVFRVAAERLSFTRAAEELFISQPAVTKHINELERQLGVPLFVRRSNSVFLTTEGEVLLGYARRILALYADLNDALGDENGEPVGMLHVGASTTIAQYLLPAVLPHFKKRFSQVGVTLTDGNTRQIERMVADERLDFGLIEGIARDPQLHYEPFMEDELVLVTAANNRSITQEEIGVSELAKLPLVIRETGSGTLEVVERALVAQGIPMRSLSVEMQLGSTESIKHYLYGSEAVAFVSIHAVLEELRHNMLRVIDIRDFSVTRNFSFVSRHGHNSRLSNRFKQFCEEKWRNFPGGRSRLSGKEKR